MQLLCRKSDQLKEQDMAPVRAVIVTVAVVSPEARVSDRHFTPMAPLVKVPATVPPAAAWRR